MKRRIVKIFCTILILICLVCIFNGCAGRTNFIGKWYDEKTNKLVLTLNSNGKGSLLGYDGTYNVYASYIEIKLEYRTVKLYYEKLGINKIKTSSYIDGDNIGNLTLIRK